MSSLTKCLMDAMPYLPPEAVAKVTRLAREYRWQGLEDAEKRAVSDVLGESKTKLGEVETAMAEGRALYDETPPDTAGGKAEAEAMPGLVDQIARDFPGLMVRMDGDDAARPLRDFIQAIKSEADEMVADSELLQIAAACAAVHGA